MGNDMTGLPRVPHRRPAELGRNVPLTSRVPLRAVSITRADGSGQVGAATRRMGSATSGRGGSFPPAVAALIDVRDPWCVYCGSPSGLHRHHRRSKGHGGDPRPHTDCACNGVRVCGAHHEWAHTEGRREAEAEGLIIPRAITEPWTISVLVHVEDGGLRKFPSCDGRWLDYAPEAGAA